MHGILALSALHLAYIYPDQAGRYISMCDKHQNIALEKYRNILASGIDSSSADALFAFASIISVSSMARACSPATMSRPGIIDMDAVGELFYLTRGVRDVIGLAHRYIEHGPMEEMFRGHSMPGEAIVELPEEVAERFKLLHQMLLECELVPENVKHCQSALGHLEEIYQNIVYWAQASDSGTGQVWRWVTGVDTEFVRMVQARVAPALIILAYFAAATAAIDTAWYTDRWGEYCLHGIGLELAPELQHWLEWPLHHLQRHMDILGVQPSEGAKRFLTY